MGLSAFARKHDVTRQTASAWRKAGLVVPRAGQVDVAASGYQPSNPVKNPLRLGLATLTPEQGRDILEIVEDRHNRGSTIVTSQLPVDHWHEAIANPTIADAFSIGSCTTRIGSPSRAKACETAANVPDLTSSRTHDPMKPSTGAAVRLHRNAVRHRPDSLSAFKWNACPPSPEFRTVTIITPSNLSRGWNDLLLAH